MSTLPVRDDQALQYISDRVTPWQAAPTAIGLTAAEITSLKSALTAAQEALGVATAARAAAKAATVAFNAKMKRFRGEAGGLIKEIRSFAGMAADPAAVYAAAQIDPPAPRQPALPPTAPTQLRAVIENGGALTLEWKPTTPAPAGQDAGTSGVVYAVRRGAAGQPASSFVTVGLTPAARAGTRGVSTFTDTTLAASAGGVQYQIVPQRMIAGKPALVGPGSVVFTVTLGTAGGGTTILSQGEAAGLKMAA